MTRKADLSRSGIRDPLTEKVRGFSERLKRAFAEKVTQDPAGFRREAVRVFRASLSPGPGRPPSADVTRAARERERGTAWSEIYPFCIPGHGDLSRDAQRIAEENLRAAVRARRNTRRRKILITDSSPN